MSGLRYTEPLHSCCSFATLPVYLVPASGGGGHKMPRFQAVGIVAFSEIIWIVRLEMLLRSGQPEGLIERVHSGPDPAASVIQEADPAFVSPSNHSGEPRPLAWLADFLQVAELEDRFIQADSSSGGERAPLFQALGQSLLKRGRVVLKRLQSCASASIVKLKVETEIRAAYPQGQEYG